MRKFFFGIFLILATIGLVGCGLISNNKIEDGEMSEYKSFIFDDGSSLSSKGYVYNDKVVHFVDVDSGVDVVLCSKPDCNHTIRSKCDGFLSDQVIMEYIFGDKLIFVAIDEGIASNVDVLNDKFVFSADLDGKNKKKICEINGVQSIVRGTVKGSWLTFTYINSFDTDNMNEVALQKLDKNKSGVYMVNVETGEVKHIEEIEDYGAQCYMAYMTEDKVFYINSFYNEPINYKEYEEAGKLDEYWQKTGDALRQNLYCYEIDTGEKTLIWDGRHEHIYGNDEYIYYTDQDKIHVYKNGTLEFETNIGKLAIHSPEFITYYVHEDILYMADEKKVWRLNLNNGEVEYIGNGGLDNKGINRIVLISGEKVFYMVIQHNGTSHIYACNWDEFCKGDMSGAILMR